MFGSVQIAQPIPLTVITGLLLVIAAFLTLFLVYGEYARKVTVQGYLQPDGGVSKIYSPADGVASRVFINEGDIVSEGAPLVEVSVARSLVGGDVASTEILAELVSQRSLLEQQITRKQEEYPSEMRWLAERRALALVEEQKMKVTYALQEDRIELSSLQVAAVGKLGADGFVSNTQVLILDAEKLFEQKQLAELSLRLTRTEIETRNVERLIARQPMEHQDRIDALRRDRSSINQQIKQIKASSQFVVSASVSGRIATRNILSGAQVIRSRVLVTIVPEESTLYAWLLIPSRAAGFAAEGDEVRLMYDSFPYQQFGTQRGEIITISDSTMDRLEIAGIQMPGINEPVFIAKVRLDKDTITAFGKEKRLQVDMLLNADIVLAQRSILNWLLEPLYALRGRT